MSLDKLLTDITLKLGTVLYALKRDNLRELCVEELLRVQWIKKELGFSSGFFSLSCFWLDMIRYNQIWCMNVNRTQI